MAPAQGEIEKGYTGGQMSKANEPNAHSQGNSEGTRSPKANNETYGSGERKIQQTKRCSKRLCMSIIQDLIPTYIF